MTQHELQRPRVNITQACAIAGVCRRSIYYWLETGKVEYVRTAGGSVRIYVDTLLRRPKAEQDADFRRTLHARA